MTESEFKAAQNRVKAGVGDIRPYEGYEGPKMQKRKGPNKTEKAFGEWLKRQGWEPEFEPLTLRLPGGTRYTPDWMVCEPKLDWDNPVQSDESDVGFAIPQTGYRTLLFEVKGFMREAARVRLKESAAHFRNFEFYLVRAKNRALTDWQITEVG